MAKVYSLQITREPHQDKILPFTALPMSAIITLMQCTVDIIGEDIDEMQKRLAEGKSYTFVGGLTYGHRLRATVVVAEITRSDN